MGGIQTPISHAVNVHLHIGGGENQIVHSGSLHSRVSSGNGIHGTTVRAHIIAVLIETRGRSNTPLSVSFGTVAHHGTHNPGSLDIGGDVARTQLGDVVTPVNTNVNDAGVVHILAQLQSLLHLGGVHSQVAIGIKESGVLRVQDGAQHGVVAGETAGRHTLTSLFLDNLAGLNIVLPSNDGVRIYASLFKDVSAVEHHNRSCIPGETQQLTVDGTLSDLTCQEVCLVHHASEVSKTIGELCCISGKHFTFQTDHIG